MRNYMRFQSHSDTSTVSDIKATQWATVINENADGFACDKLTFVSDQAVSVKINGADNWSALAQDSVDNKYKLSFDKGDILIKTFEVNAAVDYWCGFLY